MRSRHAPRPRAARLFSVLALLLGLLGMHGLASGHHGPVAAAGAAVPAGSSTDRHGSTHDEEHGGSARDGGTAAAAVPGLPSLGAPCTDCPEHAGALLCLAVLSAGLALVARLLAERLRTPGLPAPALLPVVRAGPPLRLRPPDPVAQLCVSRT